MARPETRFQNDFRRVSGWASDRIETTMGSTPGFPDTVFWVPVSGPSGPRACPLPVEFKIGKINVNRSLVVEFRPVQKLWWRRAHREGYTAAAAIKLGDNVLLLSPGMVVRLVDEGLTLGQVALSVGASHCYGNMLDPRMRTFLQAQLMRWDA